VTGVALSKLSTQLKQDLKDSMKSRDKIRLETVRSVISQLKYAEIEVGEEIDETGEIKVLKRLLKQRKEAAVQFREGNRTELAEKEEQEAVILEAYLPAQLSETDLKNLINAVAERLEAKSKADFGRLMKEVIAECEGRADGKVISQIVKEKLG